MHARSAIISVRVDVIMVGFPYTGAHPLIIIFPLCLQNIDQACAALFLQTDPSQAAAKFPFFQVFHYSSNLGFCYVGCAPVLFSPVGDGVEGFDGTVLLDVGQILLKVMCPNNFDGVGREVLDIGQPWSFFVCCLSGIRRRSSSVGWQEGLVGG